MAQDGKTAADDAARAQAPRLLFASYHCYLDPSSGAAIATRDLLELLASHGWSVRVFCGARLDFERGESLRQLLSDQGIAFEERTCREGGAPSPPAPLPRPSSMVPGEGSSGMATFSLVEFRQNGVPVTVFVPAGPGRSVPSPDEGAAFLAFFERVLDEYRPDVLLSYGGSWLASRLMARARQRGAAVVFGLHNFEYRDASRVVLMPSLWRESFGRVAAEALVNGIPVLATRRGALPEVLREAGFLFDIPERYTPESRIVPSPEEVAPWVETVIRLWDDAAVQEAES